MNRLCLLAVILLLESFSCLTQAAGTILSPIPPLTANDLALNVNIETYWKSVQEPGQGIFVGEPLAKPFAYKP